MLNKVFHDVACLVALCWLVHDGHPYWAIVPVAMVLMTQWSVTTTTKTTTTEDDK